MAIFGKNKKSSNDYKKTIPYGFLNVGDRVRVKDREWYDRLPRKDGSSKVSAEHDLSFTDEMECFLGRTFEVGRILRGADAEQLNMGPSEITPKEIYKLKDRRPNPIISEYDFTVDEYFFTIEMLEFA